MTEKVTKIKDPAAQARGKKAWKTQLESIKAKHLEEIKNGKETSSTGTDTPNTGSSTPSSSTDTLSQTLIIIGLVCIGGFVGFYAFKSPIVSARAKTPEKYEKTPQKNLKHTCNTI